VVVGVAEGTAGSKSSRLSALHPLLCPASAIRCGCNVINRS
jgi:hypothetical protein